MTTEKYVENLLRIAHEAELLPFLEKHGKVLALRALPLLKERAEALMLADPGEAMRVARWAEQVAEYAGDPLGLALSEWAMGNVLMYQGEYEECLQSYQQAMAVYAERGMDLEVARLQTNCVAALINLGRYSQALETAERARSILEGLGPTRFLATLKMNLGVLYKNTDRYEDALAAYERDRGIFATIGDEVQEARMNVNRALALEKLDRFREAVAILQGQALPVLVRHGRHLEIARLHLNLGLLYTRLGRYRDALRELDEARRGFDDLGVETEVATVDWHKAGVYARLNLLPDVVELCGQARAVFEEHGMARYVANADLDAAVAYRRLDEGERALRLLAEARGILAERDVPVRVALLDLERAAALLAEGLLDQALAVAETAQATLVSRGLAVKAAQAQLAMAAYLMTLDEINAARCLYQDALQVASTFGLAELAYRAHQGLGRVAEEQGELEAALAHYRRAMAQVESVVASLGLGEFMAGFMDDKLAVYQSAMHLSLRLGEVAGAFDFAEWARSSVMLALLTSGLQARPRLEDELSQRLLAELGQLKEEWHWQRSGLEQEGLEEGAGREEPRLSRKELAEVERAILETVRSLQLRDERASLASGAPPSLPQVQAHLDEDTVLLEYTVVHDRVLAFLISGSGATVWQNLADMLDVDRELDMLRFSLRSLNSDAQEHLQRLYRMLLEPMAEHLMGHHRLIIVPHDVLHYLPFHALHDGQRYLFERWEVSYLPAASLLQVTGERDAEATATGRPVALIMGYSHEGRLPLVLDEIEAVRSVFPTAYVFAEGEATADHLREYGPGCHLLHLASHAVFRDDNPLFSSLRLADTALTVHDIYGLSLPRARLVTLSACETGVGQLRGGDLIGLSQAFLYAGARSLLVSLWQVQDEATAVLMERFYRGLAAGQSKAAALREAQLALLGQEAYRHPFYWAGWVLVGEG